MDVVVVVARATQNAAAARPVWTSLWDLTGRFPLRGGTSIACPVPPVIDVTRFGPSVTEAAQTVQRLGDVPSADYKPLKFMQIVRHKGCLSPA
jgi:hypothetical protein